MGGREPASQLAFARGSERGTAPGINRQNAKTPEEEKRIGVREGRL
jgi:hypothetical protein